MDFGRANIPKAAARSDVAKNGKMKRLVQK